MIPEPGSVQGASWHAAVGSQAEPSYRPPCSRVCRKLGPQRTGRRLPVRDAPGEREELPAYLASPNVAGPVFRNRPSLPLERISVRMAA